MDQNDYIPKLARIINIKEEVAGERSIKTFKTQFINGNFIVKSVPNNSFVTNSIVPL